MQMFFFLCAVLEDFTEYNDAEALEIWGNSLMTENKYDIAEKKISLALSYAKVRSDVSLICRGQQISVPVL